MSSAPFRWSAKREEAALLVARDQLTNQQIAARVGVARYTLDRWKLHPEFAARVASHVDSFRTASLAAGLADRDARLAALDDLLGRLRVLMDARARDMGGVPGGETGLLIRRVKRVLLSAHPDSTPARTLRREPVEEYELDPVLLRTILALARNAAGILGQWNVAPKPVPVLPDIPEEWLAPGLPPDPDSSLPTWLPGQPPERN